MEYIPNAEACFLCKTFSFPWCSKGGFLCFLIYLIPYDKHVQKTKLQNKSMISLRLLGELHGDGMTAQLSHQSNLGSNSAEHLGTCLT